MAAAITDAGITAVVDTMVAVDIMAAVADADLPVGRDSLDAAAAEIFAVTSAVDSAVVVAVGAFMAVEVAGSTAAAAAAFMAVEVAGSMVAVEATAAAAFMAVEVAGSTAAVEATAADTGNRFEEPASS